jgi:two-component system, LytTR family, sensor kinase
MVYALVGLLCAVLVLLGWYCFEQRRRFDRRIADAELRRLRAQLNPHFLFNALNAIAELGYDDPAAADRAITQLSGLLRKSLDENHSPEISLEAELDFLEDYLSLQRMLIRDAIDIALTVDPIVLHARVPAMILQPLVENALIHGAVPGARGRVAITVERFGRDLAIEVHDNGPGVAAQSREVGRPGIGLSNTRARLAHLYGRAASVVLENRADGGAIARITLPFHELP